MISFLSPDIAFSFVTLSFLEIVLGIDNLIFIALAVQKLPKKRSRAARFIGLSLALGIRVVMLTCVKAVMSFTNPVFVGLSVKDLLLIAGGLFLIFKGAAEIRTDLTRPHKKRKIRVAGNFSGAIVQIAFIDFIFSFDSIITAIGITLNIPVIIAAVVVSMVVMLFASGYLADFLAKYPGFKVLGLAFIGLVGLLLLAEGLHWHIDRNYVYFALVFSIAVESLNTLRRRHK